MSEPEALSDEQIAAIYYDNCRAGFNFYKFARAIAALAAPSTPASQAPGGSEQAMYAILFDDYDKRPEIIQGETVARARFRQISDSWNAHLFGKLESNSRDDSYANNNIAAPSTPAAPCKQCDASIILSVSPYLVVNGSNEAMDELSRQLRAPSTPSEALSDEQIDKALEAWFANGPVGIEHKTDRTRMRAAIAALAAPSTPAAEHEYRKGFIDGQIDMRDRDAIAPEALSDEQIMSCNRGPQGGVYLTGSRWNMCEFARAVLALAAPSTPAAATPVRSSDAEVSRYWELLYAVERKHHGETRHQTALRYIRQAERGADATVAATQAQASDHTEQALGMVLSDAEIEKEAGNRVGNIAYKVGFVEGAKFALGRTP